MSRDEKELWRLVGLLLFWPTEEGRAEFGTDLKCRRAVEDQYRRVMGQRAIDVEGRLQKLEEVAHAPFDFTEVIEGFERRLKALETGGQP